MILTASLLFYLSLCPNLVSSKKTNTLMEFLLVVCFSLIISFSSGTTDTISANYSLSGDQTITSNGDDFVLGFFKAGNSTNYYVGIWYKKVSLITVVWVANRETPVSDRFNSELKIIDGNLVLLNESKLPIWSTNVTTTTNLNSTIAVIRNDGNLVLSFRNGSNSVWQSFDHPTHSWLPGAKLDYNNIIKRSQIITSWKSEDNPAVGLYSLELDPNKKQYVCKWNGSEEYWTSGPWDGEAFEDVPGMRFSVNFNFSFISNVNESYLAYYIRNASIMSRLIIDVSGQLQQHVFSESTKQWVWYWSRPETQCGIYAFCGAFGMCRSTGLPCTCVTGFKPRSEIDWNQSIFSGGCVRKTNLQCWENVKKSDFVISKVSSLPRNNFVTVVSGGGECRTTCLNNCSCNAYSFEDNQCLVWYGDLMNFIEDNSNGKTIYIKVASKDVPHDYKNNRVHVGMVVGFVVGVVVVLGLILLLLYRKKRTLVEKMTMEGSLVAFVYKDLQIATKHFSNKLGGGGFGSVFKGVLCDSSIVAVKKLESISQGEKQFRSEVSTIGNIQHVNLVRLRGFCAQGDNKLLVYDCMPNGFLNSHLFNEKQENLLNWKTRYEIALGIARGLVYLHENCRDCIIHCDIKPENVLLDANFCPKIADFGLAKIVGRDFSRVLTTMRGTLGYVAPEWLSGVAITPKADVFSYGMMLFELVHGKRNAQHYGDSSFTFFPSLASSVVMAVDGDILSLLDSRLNREASVEEVLKILKVAYWCIQDEEDKRPSMSHVEQILEGLVDVNMPPIPQSVKFFIFGDNTDNVLLFNELSLNRSSQVQSNCSSGDY